MTSSRLGLITTYQAHPIDAARNENEYIIEDVVNKVRGYFPQGNLTMSVIEASRAILARTDFMSNLRLLFFNEFQSFILRNYVNCTRLGSEANTIALLSDVKHFRSECGTDELAVGRR